MASFRTYEYALKPSPEQKKDISAMLDRQDKIYNDMAELANWLFYNGTAYEMIQAAIDNYVVSEELCPKAAAKLKGQLSKQLGRLSRGEIASIYKRKRNRKRRRIQVTTAYIVEKYVNIVGIGYVETVFHRPLPSNVYIYAANLCESQYGTKYNISFDVVFNEPQYMNRVIDYQKVIGLDYKQTGLYVDSKGNSGAYPGFYAQNKAKLNELYKTANRFKPGSSRWLKFMRRAEKLEQHIKNQRKDWQFKQAARLAEENDAVCVETLDFDEMKKQNASLGLKIYDNYWGGFKSKLNQNLQKQGKPLIQISQYYPSSQICSVCGYTIGKQPLSQRTIRCPYCGAVIDRDYNAACNIRNEGIGLLSAA